MINRGLRDVIHLGNVVEYVVRITKIATGKIEDPKIKMFCQV